MKKLYASLARPVDVNVIGYAEFDKVTSENWERLQREDTDARIAHTLLGRWMTHMQGFTPIHYQVTRVYKVSVEVRRCYGINSHDWVDSDWGDKITIDLAEVTSIIRSRDALRMDIGVIL